jgi:hypothetical protein
LFWKQADSSTLDSVAGVTYRTVHLYLRQIRQLFAVQFVYLTNDIQAHRTQVAPHYYTSLETEIEKIRTDGVILSIDYHSGKDIR